MKVDLGIASQRTASRHRALWFTWAVGALLMGALFADDVATFHHGYIANRNFWGRDFVNLWTGGRLVLEGRWPALNDFSAFSAYQQKLFPSLDGHNYSYPPVSYPLAATFARLPYWAALTAWVAATTALFAYACRQWWPSGAGPAWFAALTPAVLLNIWDGQYGCLIGALFLLGWQWLDDHPRRAGVAFGLLLLKPHLAILIPLALLIRRDWSAIAAAAATVVSLVIVTAATFGAQSWLGLLFRTGPGLASMIDARGTFVAFMSTSTATALIGLGVGWKAALVAQALLALAAVVVVAVAAWKQTPTRELAFLVATCTFLALPYGFNYDLTVVGIGALALAVTGADREFDRVAALCGFIAAPLGMLLQIVGLPGAPVILVCLAAAQFRRWVLPRLHQPKAEAPRRAPDDSRQG